jgi:putative oxidoreductase
MLRQWLAKCVGPAFIFMRVISGLMLAQHGVQKLFGVLGGQQRPLLSQLGIGAIIELVAGLCIAFGFQTLVAAFIASGTMAVAYVQFHWKLSFGAGFFPVVNKGELALLYCVVFFFIACHTAARGSRT